MTITPDVPTSSRCTIPCRSEAPPVAIRNPAPARCPTTVGPRQPGEGCTATPTGLSITTMESSSWMILIPSTISGTTSSGSASHRDADLEQRAVLDPVALGRPVEPSTRTWPSAIRSAARVRDRPKSRASAASTRSPSSPSGTESVRWSAWLTGRPRRGSPSIVMPRKVWSTITAAAALMQMSATLKTGKFGTMNRSTTWPCSGSGSRKIRSVRLPTTPAEQQAEPDRPPPVAAPGGRTTARRSSPRSPAGSGRTCSRCRC